ncbi:hypothetical protein SESBI_46582 [Sesbania bispinosa]|nr:hypothetical protein SESBI_46582 [Sesbania bispinosa]
MEYDDGTRRRSAERDAERATTTLNERWRTETLNERWRTATTLNETPWSLREQQ